LFLLINIRMKSVFTHQQVEFFLIFKKITLFAFFLPFMTNY